MNPLAQKDSPVQSTSMRCDVQTFMSTYEKMVMGGLAQLKQEESNYLACAIHISAELTSLCTTHLTSDTMS